jgi:polygalacturonase
MKISVSVLAMFLTTACCVSQNSEEKARWDEAYKVIQNLKEPVFPNKTYNILDFGAVGDGVTKNTAAIDAAINKCSNDGGGHVIVPKGDFLTGPIHMKSNVDLHIDSTAVLRFSTTPSDYLPLVLTRWEGDDCYNYSPLIYANGQKNFAITGKGTLNGQGSATNWWPWKGNKSIEWGWKEGTPSQLDENCRPLLKKYNDNQVPVEKRQMGEGHYLRPQFISFIYCKNLKIEDVTILNSPFWVIHPLLSENIIVRNVTVNSVGPNNDGCDPESCKNVLIEKCTFNTGDDCIALKSGRDFDGRKANAPIENVIIRNCHMKNGHGGVSIGSEIAAGSKNIFVENCQMNSPELERAFRIKSNNNRGGISDGLYFRNITVGEVNIAVLAMECQYHIDSEGEGKYPPLMKNVYFSNITSQKSTFALSLVGIKGLKCIDNINIRDCKFSGVKDTNEISDIGSLTVKNVQINGKPFKYEN